MACMVLLGVLILVTPQQALADGTPSNTTISNTATINYDVGTISQTPVDSPATTFVVDNKVDLTVATTDGSAVTVTPGSNQAGGVYNVLTFTVTNDGNTTQDYALSYVAVATGGSTRFAGLTDDAFNMTNVNIFVEEGTTAGYQFGVDAVSSIDALAMDTTVTVYIVADTLLAQTNGQYASYHLVATTHTDTGAGLGPVTANQAGDVYNPNTVQVVWGDTAGSNDAALDGAHSSQDDYLVDSAALTVTKTSVVASDPFASAVPKAVPGAVVTYSVQVTNNGGVIATSVVIEDEIPTNTAYVVPAVPIAGATYSDDGGTSWIYTPTGSGPNNTDTAVTDIRLPSADVAASGGSETTTFQVEIL